MSENTTTTELTDDEVLAAAAEMGLTEVEHHQFSYHYRTRWEVCGYEIVIRNSRTSGCRYEISMEGDVLDRGVGGLVEAMRAFLLAGE